jgi:hypothetical protein
MLRKQEKDTRDDGASCSHLALHPARLCAALLLVMSSRSRPVPLAPSKYSSESRQRHRSPHVYIIWLARRARLSTCPSDEDARPVDRQSPVPARDRVARINLPRALEAKPPGHARRTPVGLGWCGDMKTHRLNHGTHRP